MTDNQQTAFEAWCARVGLPVDKDSSGTYKYIGTHSTNLAWQAALESPEVEALRDALDEIINCPQSVDEATIPAGGVEVNPAQVILTMSVSLVRIRKARAVLAAMEN